MKHMRAIAAAYSRAIIICIIILPVLLVMVAHHQPAGTLQETTMGHTGDTAPNGLTELLLKK
jgi:hypothetical protein